MSAAHYHVFIPGLFAPLPLWQRDFAFQPESPALMRLLASHYREETAVKGLERSLLHWLGVDVEGQLPWAVLRHAMESDGMYQPPLLCADPVHLQTGSDAIVLHPESPPDLSREETERLFADLNEHLALDGLVLKAFHPQRWYLHQLDESFTKPLPLTTPLSEVGGGNIFPALPQSDDKYWHQLLNEIQMLLHNHKINQARENTGQLVVNGIWLWGEGEVDVSDLRHINGVLGGGDVGELLAATAQCSWQSMQAPPAEMGSGDLLVILDQLQAVIPYEQPHYWQQTLDDLQSWFEFLQAVLNNDGGVSIYDADGRVFHCEKVPGWQFWRSHRAEWGSFC